MFGWMKTKEEKFVKAARKGNLQKVKNMLSEGMKADCMTGFRYQPIDYAYQNKDTEMMEVLLQAGANPYWNVFLTAMSDDNEEVKSLLKKYFKSPGVFETTSNPLTTAASHRDLSMCQKLLEVGFDPNEGGDQNKPLSSAMRTEDNLEVIETLLKAGANPNYRAPHIGSCLLAEALRCEFDDFKAKAELLLAHGYQFPDESEIGDTLVLKCVINREHEYLKYILEKGANPNVFDRNGSTPLMIGVSFMDVVSVKQLLKHGANPKIENQKGEIAEMKIPHMKEFQMLQLLNNASKTVH